MNMTNDNQDFTTGSIPRKLLKFMLPIFGSLVLQAMYGAVDLLIVGRFGTTAGLSGVSTGSNILNMVTFTVCGLAMSVTILIGRYLGEKKNEQIGPLIGGTIALFTIISCIICLILVIFARPLAIIMQSPAEALDLTAQYVRICGFGIFFIISYNVISAVFRGLGDSRTPLIFVGIACAVNVVGDLLLVAVLRMNVAGAAIATVVAQGVSVVTSLFIMQRRTLPFTMRRSYIRLNSEVKHIITVGAPLALQEFLSNISFMCLCAFINRLGLEASSGYGVANKIVNFIMLVPSSLMQSMASFISQNVGAGLEKRAKKALAFGMSFGFIIGIFIFALVFFKGDLLTGIFTKDPTVIQNGWDYLKGFGAEAMVTCILFSFMGYFNGHEKSLFVMLQSIAQTFLVRLPVSYFMSIQPGTTLTSIGLAAPLATCFGITINLIFFIWYNKNVIRKRENRS